MEPGESITVSGMTATARFLEHLSQAIRIDTVSHDGASDTGPFVEFHRFLARTYPTMWSRLEVERFNDLSLLLTWPGSDTTLAPVILMAHQDVVPVEPSSMNRWSKLPFAGESTDTHVVGRGAIDDKASLIAILESVEALLEDGASPTRTLILAFGHDEEAMGALGAASMAAELEKRGIRAELVLDEGGFVTEGVVPGTRKPVALLGVGEKGYLDVEIAATGDPGHSSVPPRNTAIGILAKAIRRLMDNRPQPRVETQAPFFEAAAAAARGPSAKVLASIPRLGKAAEALLSRRATTDALIRTTVAPTRIEGGVKANVLAASARVLINFRIIPGDTVESTLDHVRRTVGKDVTVKALEGWDPPPMSSTSSEAYRTMAETIEEVFPDSVVAPWVVVGATDARYFSSISDSVFRFLPFRLDADELAGFHGIDERMRRTDAEPAVRFYTRLIQRLCM